MSETQKVLRKYLLATYMSGLTAVKGITQTTILIVFIFYSQKNSTALPVGPHVDVRKLSILVPLDGQHTGTGPLLSPRSGRIAIPDSEA